jgi:hypothetical protein
VQVKVRVKVQMLARVVPAAALDRRRIVPRGRHHHPAPPLQNVGTTGHRRRRRRLPHRRLLRRRRRLAQCPLGSGQAAAPTATATLTPTPAPTLLARRVHHVESGQQSGPAVRRQCLVRGGKVAASGASTGTDATRRTRPTSASSFIQPTWRPRPRPRPRRPRRRPAAPPLPAGGVFARRLRPRWPTLRSPQCHSHRRHQWRQWRQRHQSLKGYG